MNNLIISAIGSDRSGIVSELSSIITSHGGNIEESRMTILGSDFAIIMHVLVSPDWQASLELTLKNLNELKIITKSTNIQKESNGVQCQIDLSGADNEGIVNVLSAYLARKSINIIDMETYISNAPITGTPLFNLNALTAISEDVNISEIQSDLTLIAHKLGVEITVNQSECRADTA